MGKGSSPPPPPDYTAAAREQGDVDRASIREQTFANRPNQITPWGALRWTPGQTVDPTTGEALTTWEQNQTLSPELGAAFGAQSGLANERSQLAGGMFGRVRQVPHLAPTVIVGHDEDEVWRGGNGEADGCYIGK